MTTVSRIAWLALCAGLLSTSPSRRANGAMEKPQQESVSKVAEMLPEQPAGFGRLITDRAAWERLAATPSYRGVVPRAEALLKQPLPDTPDDLYLDFSRTGNRTRWQRVAGQRRSRIAALTLAECLEDKGRFLPALEEAIAAVCAERTWVMPAHDRGLANFHGKTIDIDLGSAHLGWDLAMAHYLLGDRLSRKTRQLIRENLSRRIFQPYLDMLTGKRRKNWWMTGTNNWNTVCLAGVTGAALAVIESREERATFVEAARAHSRYFLRGFPADGCCTEGLGYWSYGFGHYLLLAEALWQATDGHIDLLTLDQVQKPATYAFRIEIINGIYPAFADCSVGTRPSEQMLRFIRRRFALGGDPADDAAMVSPGGHLGHATMYSFPNSATQAPPSEARPDGLGLRSWFDEAGVLIGRPAKGSASRMGVALKGGHNAEHHNHNDVGSYVVVLGKRAVLLDPGAEVYTARTFSSRRYDSKVLNSFGHAVPLVAGQLQRSGRRAEGKVVRTEFTDAADTLVLDLRPAYAVPELTRLQRTFVYSRDGAGALTVTDEVAFRSPQAFETALITLGHWKRLGPASLRVYDLDEAVRAEIDAAGAEFDLHAEEIHEDVRTRSLPTRIAIRLKSPVAQATVTIKIRPIVPANDRRGSLLRNGGFEDEAWCWDIPQRGMGAISTEQAASGERSLKIVDESHEVGSNIHSARIPVQGGGAFQLRGKAFPVSGDGLGLYIKFYDADRRLLNELDERGYIDSIGTLGGSSRRWEPFAFGFSAPEDTAFLQVWVHSITSARIEAYLDDLEVVRAEPNG